MQYDFELRQLENKLRQLQQESSQIISSESSNKRNEEIDIERIRRDYDMKRRELLSRHQRTQTDIRDTERKIEIIKRKNEEESRNQNQNRY